MTCYVAFLRGINLGNRRLTMDELRGHLEGVGLDGVSTYRASGNVVFDVEGGDPGYLEETVEGRLAERLGYRVDTFVRGLDRVASLAGHPAAEVAKADRFKPHVLFLKKPAGPEVLASFRELESADDRFHVLEREVIWLRRGGMADSPIEPRHLEAAVGGPGYTQRTLGTVRRIARKFGE